MDDGERTTTTDDGGCHPISSPGAFGSGELKSYKDFIASLTLQYILPKYIYWTVTDIDFRRTLAGKILNTDIKQELIYRIHVCRSDLKNNNTLFLFIS